MKTKTLIFKTDLAKLKFIFVIACITLISILFFINSIYS